MADDEGTVMTTVPEVIGMYKDSLLDALAVTNLLAHDLKTTPDMFFHFVEMRLTCQTIYHCLHYALDMSDDDVTKAVSARLHALYEKLAKPIDPADVIAAVEHMYKDGGK